MFATFDKDGSGTVEKAEMVTFIKTLLGWATKEVVLDDYKLFWGMLDFIMKIDSIQLTWSRQIGACWVVLKSINSFILKKYLFQINVLFAIFFRLILNW